MIPKSSTVAVMKENRKKRKAPMMNRGLWFKMGLLLILIIFFMPIVNASTKTKRDREAEMKRMLAVYSRQKTKNLASYDNSMNLNSWDNKEFNCDICKESCTEREAKPMGCKDDHRGHEECIDNWKKTHAKKTCPACKKYLVLSRPKRDDEHWMVYKVKQIFGSKYAAGTFGLFLLLDMLYFTSVLSPYATAIYLWFLFIHFFSVIASFFVVGFMELAKDMPDNTTIIVVDNNSRSLEENVAQCICALCCMCSTMVLGQGVYHLLIPGSNLKTKLVWAGLFFVQILVLLVTPHYIKEYGENGEGYYVMSEILRDLFLDMLTGTKNFLSEGMKRAMHRHHDHHYYDQSVYDYQFE